MTSFTVYELMDPKALRQRAHDLRESANAACQSSDNRLLDDDERAYQRRQMQELDIDADYCEGLALAYEGFDLMAKARNARAALKQPVQATGGPE